MSIPRLFQETSIFKPNAINDFVETEITNAEASIKITTDEITSRVTLAEAAISANSSRLTSAESSITQNANAITLKANSTDVYTKTQSDGLISTEVDNRNAAISAAIDSITLSVSQTYTTKTELATEESKRKASWATCSTGASAQAKTASCSNFQLYSGVLISVLFQNTNTHATPTLNVNSTGAKFIRSQTGQALSEGEYKWPAGCVRTFVYDGTYWRFSDDGTIARVTQAEASISINADNIASKVSTTDYTGSTVASLINQSADSVKIQANHIIIDGTATFNAIKSSADATYDAIGAAATAKTEAISAANSATDSKLENYSTTQEMNSAISAVSNAAAPKSSAIKRTQRIYYQSNSTTAPSTPGTSSSNWVTDTSGSANRWTLKRMSYASATPYIWTCEQKETVSGAVSYTSVLFDDTTTVIDGGKIITGSIAANKLSVYDATIQKIRASAIDTNSITIGYSQINNRPTDVGDLTNNVGYQTSNQVSSSISTAISSSVYRTQRIYYRASSSLSTLTGPTTWLSTSGTGYGNWSLKIPPLVNGSTKYPFLYTCVQTQTMSQAANNGTSCNVSAVLLDDTTTVIDGGNIITGSVSANAISATSGTFNTANIPNLSAAKITSGDISAARIKANVIPAINSLTAGTIDAARINVSALRIGYSQISDTPTIPTTTSQLTNNSNFGTTDQIATAKSEAISAAASDATTKANNAKSSAISTAASDASSKAATAKSEAISAAASDATTKANAAAQTATNYLTIVDNTGLMVHTASVANTGVKITSSVDIMQDGVSVANYGSTARIGKTGQLYVSVQSDGMSVYNNLGSAEIITLKHKTLTNAGYGELAFLSNGNAYSGGVVKATNGNKFDSISFNVGSSDVSTTIMSSDPDKGTSASIVVDGTNSKIKMSAPLCFLAGTANGGSNIIGIYAGSTTATLSNGNWASLASKSTLESKLGSGVTNTNTIIIAQNGDCNAVGNYAFSGAITNDGAARGYVYPAINGAVRWNWIAIRFSN